MSESALHGVLCSADSLQRQIPYVVSLTSLIVKLVISAAVGSARYRLIAGGVLLAMGAAIAAGLALVRYGRAQAVSLFAGVAN